MLNKCIFKDLEVVSNDGCNQSSIINKNGSSTSVSAGVFDDADLGLVYEKENDKIFF